jgi:hypothetical protein
MAAIGSDAMMAISVVQAEDFMGNLAIGFVAPMLGRRREPPVQPLPDPHEERRCVSSRFIGRATRIGR